MLSLLLMLTLAHAAFPVLYEISTRPCLASKGIEIVWMMGVWQLGDYGLNYDRNLDFSSVLPDYTQDDIIGSPYAIVEYNCNSDIGVDDDLLWLRNQLHEKEYYIRAAPADSYDSKYYLPSGIAHGKDPYFDPWGDVAQWNYFESATREYMKSNIMKALSVSDGVRCDMAHLVLNDVFAGTWNTELSAWGYSKPSTEFWSDAISEAKATYPNAIFMAEVYEDYQMDLLRNCGFDYTYDKAFLDKCESGVSDVNNYVHYKSLDWLAQAAHFVENHDENRAVYNMGSVGRADAAAAMAATLPGLIFFNHGQFDGLKNKLDVHLRRSYSETASTVAQQFYKKFLNVLKEDAFKSNNFYFVYNINGDSAWRFASWIRKGTDASYLVVVNYSDAYSCANVPIYDISGTGDVKVYEMMSSTEYTRNGATLSTTGLTVCINAYDAQIFKYNY
ncbi:Glycosyl hydrolase family 13 catalytic domain-containing protein [Entamoeba marina]